MKAAQINAYGPADVVKMTDIEKPTVGKGQVLIENYASCINPFDIAMREGRIPLTLPFTLGSDMAGVVIDVAESAERFKVGDKVYGSGNVLSGATGAFAEYVAVPVDSIAIMPDSISFVQAAAVVLTGVSAVQALVEHFNLQPNQKILIHGGAGGIGTIAIQIAKLIGAHVATTVNGNDIDYVKKLGADEVIDYESQSFDHILSGYDAVFDTVGGQTYTNSFKVLKKGGMMVSMLVKPDASLMEQYGVVAMAQQTKVNTKHLDMLRTFIMVQEVAVHVEKVFSLDQIQEAFEAKEKGGVKGKIAIEIRLSK